MYTVIVRYFQIFSTDLVLRIKLDKWGKINNKRFLKKVIILSVQKHIVAVIIYTQSVTSYQFSEK